MNMIKTSYTNDQPGHISDKNDEHFTLLVYKHPCTQKFIDT